MSLTADGATDKAPSSTSAPRLYCRPLLNRLNTHKARNKHIDQRCWNRLVRLGIHRTNKERKQQSRAQTNRHEAAKTRRERSLSWRRVAHIEHTRPATGSTTPSSTATKTTTRPLCASAAALENNTSCSPSAPRPSTTITTTTATHATGLATTHTPTYTCWRRQQPPPPPPRLQQQPYDRYHMIDTS